MGQQGMHSVGARLLGIYFLVHGLSLMPAALATALSLRIAADGMDKFGQTLALASVAQAILLVAAGIFLILWRRAPLPIETPVEPLRLLWVGLKLLGVFFVVSGASDILWGAVRGSGGDTATAYAKASSGALEFSAGCLLWVSARWLSSPRHQGQP